MTAEIIINSKNVKKSLNVFPKDKYKLVNSLNHRQPSLTSFQVGCSKQLALITSNGVFTFRNISGSSSHFVIHNGNLKKTFVTSVTCAHTRQEYVQITEHKSIIWTYSGHKFESHFLFFFHFFHP